MVIQKLFLEYNVHTHLQNFLGFWFYKYSRKKPICFQLSSMFQAVPMVMLIFLLRNSSYAHWQWKSMSDFQCIAQQMVHFVPYWHKYTVVLKRNKGQARQQKQTLYINCSRKNVFFELKNNLFFFQSSGQHSYIKLPHSEFLCMLRHITVSFFFADNTALI